MANGRAIAALTMALNMYTQGVDPQLDFSDIDRVIETVEYCNELPVHQRHPYGGELVYTAFSGSHQDAIKKGFSALETQNDPHWRVPYLPIDPADLGRSYEAVIRVNCWEKAVSPGPEQDQGLKLPKKMQADFNPHVQHMADAVGREQRSGYLGSLQGLSRPDGGQASAGRLRGTARQ